MTDTQATEFNWNKLFHRLKNGNVLPVIGEDLYTVLTPEGDETLLYTYLANELKKETGLSLEPGADHAFAKAAFEFLQKSGDAYALQTFLTERIKRVTLSPSNRLFKLASIKPFKLFISTTYDLFLSQALEAVRGGEVKTFHYSRRKKSVLEDLEKTLNRAEQDRLSMVFNLYGNLFDLPDESAFSEAEILETVVAFQEDLSRGKQGAKKYYEIFRRNALLFIGCGYDDWLFRLLIRTLSTHAVGEGYHYNFFGNNFNSFTKKHLDDFLRYNGVETVWLRDNNEFIDELYERIGHESPGEIIQPDEFQNKVFISFAGKDRPVAMRLAENLIADGIQVWLDSKEILPGDPITPKIKNAITRCRAFIPLISENSRQIRTTIEGLVYHIQEWEWVSAHNIQNSEKRIPIIPVRIDDTNWIYSPFKNLRTMRIPGGNRTAGYQKLLEHLVGSAKAFPSLPKSDEKILNKDLSAPLKEVKILVVGDGGAGKTSFVKRLLKKRFDEDEQATPGINISSWSVPSNERNGNIQTYVWDFGGQEIMHATHQFFLSKLSLYILVLDSRKEKNAEYWLKYIEGFGGDSPVLVLLNKIDLNPRFDVNRKHLKDKYKNLIDFHRISCKANIGIDTFIPIIEKTLHQVEFHNINIPSSWFRVRKNLEQMEFPFIGHAEFQKLCVEEKITEESEQIRLVRFLNNLGIILHFEDFDLKDTYVLEPGWVTKGVYKIINSNQLAKGKGVLRLDDFEKIFTGDMGKNSLYPSKTHKYIIDLMKKFELCFPLEEGIVLIPNLLDVTESQFEFDYNNSLKFIFQYDFLPKSIILRLIVRMNKEIKKRLCWRSGVVLINESLQAEAVIIEDAEEKRIYVFVSGEQKKNYLTIIRHAFNGIHSSFEKLEISELVPLPDAEQITIDYDELVGLEKMNEVYLPIGKLQKRFNVKKLLDGIEAKENRMENFPNIEKINAVNIQNITIEKPEVRNMSKNTVNLKNVTARDLNLVVAESIKDSIIKIEASNSPDDFKDLLKGLADSVKIMAEKLPSEQCEQVCDDLKTFTKEASKEKPRKEWWQLSAKGIKEAAKAVGDVGLAVLEHMNKIIPILEKMV